MRAKIPPAQVRKAEAHVLVGDSFERLGNLASQIESFARQTSASHVGWPTPDDKRTGSLVVRIEYENDHYLDTALQNNHRCPGEWGFFVTRASAGVQLPPAVPEDQAATPQRNGVRRRGCRGHGRGGQLPTTNPRQKLEPESARSRDDWSLLPVVDVVMPDLDCAPDLEIPTLIVPQAHRTGPGACRVSSAPRLSLSFFQSQSCMSIPSVVASGVDDAADSVHGDDDDVARPHTAPPVEIPCRHTFIHYSSEPTPTAQRKRSLSAPALPLPSREWDLDFARQTAYVPLSRCVTPKASESDVDGLALMGAAAAPGSSSSLLDFTDMPPELPSFESTLEAECSSTTAPPGTPVRETPPRKSPELQSADSLDSPERSSPWKSTHRGSRGGRKTRGKKAGPVSPDPELDSRAS